MSSNKTVEYYAAAYKAIANLYVIDRVSLPAACARVWISLQTYYRISRKLGLSSVTTYKDARLNFISKDNNIDEHNGVN